MATTSLQKGLQQVKLDAEREALKRIADWKSENPDQYDALVDSLAEAQELTNSRLEDEDETTKAETVAPAKKSAKKDTK